MTEVLQQPVLDFYRYPSVGDDDWRYGFATAVVRTLETQMLGKAALVEMASAENFEKTAEMLGSSEYAAPGGNKYLGQMENVLLTRRSEARNLFVELMIDKDLSDLMRTREDFANLRLALRRKLTDKPLGSDYSEDGSIPAELFQAIFEQEDYTRFPDYLQDAVEAAIRVMEDAPVLNAGRGAVFTRDGRNELDASIMEGRQKRAGAVAGVQDRADRHLEALDDAAVLVLDHQLAVAVEHHALALAAGLGAAGDGTLVYENLRMVSCVPGSPIDWAAMMPTATPCSTRRPRDRSMP